MARQAKGKISLVVDLYEMTTALGIGAAVGALRHALEYVREMATGTSDGQIDRIWSTATGSVVASSPVTYDLSGAIAAILDSGVTFVLADLQAIVVKNTAAAGNLIVGASATNVGFIQGGGVSDGYGKIIIPPGGWFAFDAGTAGLAVTNASTDSLKIDASAGTVTFEVVICGRSA